ncbi:TetR/AcrR family transcriptional regulator [Nocardia harenae]|uniref:TetR/AcrR family transcriptional regulator n=1 Tax=Nocardia harenae TaxID=358707 RepID=UPI000832440B|nr:TetR/AcrR family transcriptional regulator [Nocardia harenae]
MSAPKSPANDDQASRKDRILRAAAEEFADKGEAAVRIDEIARRSGVNKQLIYYYFGSKAELYAAVLQMMVENNVAMWEETAKSNLMAGVRRLLAAKDDDDIAWSRLLAWEGIEYGGSRGDEKIVLQSRRTKAYSGVTELFRRAQSAGELAPQLDAEMLTVVWSLLNMSQTLLPQVVEMVTGLDPAGAEYAERVRAFCLTLVEHLGPGGTAPE